MTAFVISRLVVLRNHLYNSVHNWHTSMEQTGIKEEYKNDFLTGYFGETCRQALNEVQYLLDNLQKDGKSE